MPKMYWPDNTTYFLTGSTFLHYPYFNTYDKKHLVLEQIKKIKNLLNIDEIIYSIAINHYHLKLYLEKGTDLSVVKKYMHGGVTFEYRKRHKMKYKNMWQSARAFYVGSDEMDWRVTGYIIGNLLKHKEVSKIDDLKDNTFTSYDYFVEKYDKELAKDLIYSVINVDEGNNNIIDIKEMRDL